MSTALPWRDREWDAAPCGTHRFGMAILHEKQYRKTTFLHLLAKALSNAAQDVSEWLGHTVFFCSPVVHQDLQVFFCKADFQTFSPQPVPVSRVTPPRSTIQHLPSCRSSAFSLSEWQHNYLVYQLLLPVLHGNVTGVWKAKTKLPLSGQEASVEFTFYSLCLNGLTISVLGKRINHLKSIILRVILHSLYQQTIGTATD